MLNGKVYVINSPQLVQAAFRNKAISFAPLVNEYISRMHELSSSARGAYIKDGMHERMMQLFATRMAGESLRRMNNVALKEIYQTLSGPNDLKSQERTVIEVENLWTWLRNIMTMVTTTTLLGVEKNPWKKDPSLVEAYW
jgi:hypothetical protein